MLKRALTRISPFLAAVFVFFLSVDAAEASIGDRLPEFQGCVKVCITENCDPNNNPTHIPFHHRLLLWTCSQECDYTCQHIITTQRLEHAERVVQFHGKWPFYRILGMQEPFSVLFSLANMVAHQNGLASVRNYIPADYTLRPFYIVYAYIGIAAWVLSSIFHCRDFTITEQLDYFGAGATVLYGMYITAVMFFRLDKPTPKRRSLLRLWTIFCCTIYICHVIYLKMWKWDYTYNMAANVVVGLVQNALLTWMSWNQYKETHQTWAIWPACIVGWLMMAMSLELLDFPPWWGAIDAHSLWHLGTVMPTVLWYSYLVKAAQDDIAGIERFKS